MRSAAARRLMRSGSRRASGESETERSAAVNLFARRSFPREYRRSEKMRNWDSQSEKWIFDKVEGFTIRGYKGTEAERYANANGFKFVELSGKTVQGDADGDGVIDSRDRVCLTRHLAKWAGYEDIDEKAADVNADGKVDTKDRIVLARHIAKWKGYESLPYKG